MQSPAITFSQNSYDTVRFFKSLNKCPDSSLDWGVMECTYVRFIYPHFSGTNYAAKLNGIIHDLIRSTFLEGSYEDYNDYADKFFNKFLTESVDTSGFVWLHDIEIDVIDNTDRIISLIMNSYLFGSGARGTGVTKTLNFDKKFNRSIYLDDMFKPGFKDEFNRILKKNLNEEFIQLGEKEIDYEVNFLDSSNYDCSINNRFSINQNKFILYIDWYDEIDIPKTVSELEVPLSDFKNIINSRYRFLLK